MAFSSRWYNCFSLSQTMYVATVLIWDVLSLTSFSMELARQLQFRVFQISLTVPCRWYGLTAQTGLVLPLRIASWHISLEVSHPHNWTQWKRLPLPETYFPSALRTLTCFPSVSQLSPSTTCRLQPMIRIPSIIQSEQMEDYFILMSYTIRAISRRESCRYSGP